MQVKFPADLCAWSRADRGAEEIERDRSQQDLEFQKPNAVCRIASGVGEGVFIRLSI
jgi:hypothetical protein